MTKIREALSKYRSGSDSKAFRGPSQFVCRKAIQAVGGKFLTQHGGGELTNDNGMDVIDRFSEVKAFVCNVYPGDSELGRQVRDKFKLYERLAEKLLVLLRYLKSQDKRSEVEFMKILDEFLQAWDEAFPGMPYFLKLHHLMQHVYDFIKEYGMFGILSEESMEALHVLVSAIKSLTSSQPTEQRIATNNAKTQSISKPSIRAVSKLIDETRTGKARGSGTYNIKPKEIDNDNPSTNSMQHKTITIDGQVFVDTEHGRLPRDMEELYILLVLRRAPPSWTEIFTSCASLTKEMKTKLMYIDD
jgi:hypothetical protein